MSVPTDEALALHLHTHLADALASMTALERRRVLATLRLGVTCADEGQSAMCVFAISYGREPAEAMHHLLNQLWRHDLTRPDAERTRETAAMLRVLLGRDPSVSSCRLQFTDIMRRTLDEVEGFIARLGSSASKEAN